MKAVILAGGLGTRLSEETNLRPKPMVEIGDHPILWHIMKIYSHYGINDFIICLGYKGQCIKDYFANFAIHNCDVTFDLSANSIKLHHSSKEAWRVTTANTGYKTQTGGRIARIKNHLDSTFFMTYGDGLANIDIKASLDFHRKNGKLATLSAVQPPGPYCVIV